MPEQGDPPEAPQHLTFVHLGSRKMPFLQMAFMQRIPKIFRLPLLLCVPKWFSESHQLSIINLQQNKTHILIPAWFHPYPALLQGRSKWEQAISELAIVFFPGSWVWYCNAQQWHPWAPTAEGHVPTHPGPVGTVPCRATTSRCKTAQWHWHWSPRLHLSASKPTLYSLSCTREQGRRAWVGFKIMWF